jgi:hypothetical protein
MLIHGQVTLLTHKSISTQYVKPNMLLVDVIPCVLVDAYSDDGSGIFC